MGEPQGFDRKGILYRIGTFFLMLGIGLLVFFALSEAAQQVTFEYLCWSLILIALGFILHNQFKPAPPASGRGGLLRRLLKKSKDQGKK